MNTLLKTSLVSVFAAFTFAAALPAKITGSGNVTTDTRKVSGFHGIELTASGGAVITQDGTEGLVVEGEDNIVPLVETTVTDKGILRITFKSHEEIHATKPLVFRVSAKTIDSVVITGSGDVHSKSLNSANGFSVRVRGSGDVLVDHLETGSVAVAIDGSGSVKLAGKASNQAVDISGSGDYDAAGLKTSAATVNVAGSGDCDVAVSETLVATVSGSGDVTYAGKPTVTKHVSGSGSVEAAGNGTIEVGGKGK